MAARRGDAVAQSNALRAYGDTLFTFGDGARAEPVLLESLRVAASILGQDAPSAETQAERRALLARLETELANKIKSHELPLSPSTVEALMQLLATELAIVSPRFDRALHLERSE